MKLTVLVILSCVLLIGDVWGCDSRCKGRIHIPVCGCLPDGSECRWFQSKCLMESCYNYYGANYEAVNRNKCDKSEMPSKSFNNYFNPVHQDGGK